MEFASINGLKLRKPFPESRIKNKILGFLSNCFSNNSTSATNTYSVKEESWILDEPTTFALDYRKSTNWIFKDCIMKYFLTDKGRSFPDTMLETPFHKQMLRGDYYTLLVLGPNLFKEQAFYSCDIEEAGKELIKTKYNFSASDFWRLLHGIHDFTYVQYEGYCYKECCKLSKTLSKPDKMLFLPPSRYSSIPLQAMFYGFSPEDAIVYRDLLIVYRIRSIRRGHKPTIDNVLNVFFDPPYEIYVIPSPHGDNSREEYIEVHHCEDVTDEERQAYQAYFMLKMKYMMGDKLKYSTFSELLEDTNHAYSESVYLEESNHSQSHCSPLCDEPAKIELLHHAF
ncbi:uncharacterized protein NDAI_0B00575 [Naumovozyma dairenensis CBS 421]|uniref:Uncharacterized protein n=1 Tax=Naumovozyma dairenensis (strain ATCC 10597 / BCRC 20456 / CBS 421 / NBRC 0211 / NRRL Y-12639) TaxID=1071378 RepID=G0W5M9_NAUDC|nr:hypothetical protein NDAI_0B00575 [Naumovozyma dairenensis CBS 421]CCD23090.1 hypothetical protein NDAI_0B00575 [Naumovozyma dairenensis CBS 421]